MNPTRFIIQKKGGKGLEPSIKERQENKVTYTHTHMKKQKQKKANKLARGGLLKENHRGWLKKRVSPQCKLMAKKKEEKEKARREMRKKNRFAQYAT